MADINQVVQTNLGALIIEVWALRAANQELAAELQKHQPKSGDQSKKGGD